MSNFGLYAKYYNLLYQDKNYERESFYINDLIKKNINAKSPCLLDLGCGTGKHDFFFIDNGYQITGVDLSEDMIKEANENLEKQYPDSNASFIVGDIKTLRLAKKYNAVVSLFHVASYQTNNIDILAMFKTAEQHLDDNGVFIFDCWYGPAVLTRRPEVRVKRLENNLVSVWRIAEPVMHPNLNIVDVNYEVNIKSRANGTLETFTEKHKMRYFFLPELSFLLQQAGFNSISCEEWITGRQPGFESWDVVLICKKHDDEGRDLA